LERNRGTGAIARAWASSHPVQQASIIGRTMKFSLRKLLIVAISIGTLPFWFDHFLIPFFVILAICVGMAVRAFGSDMNDELDFS
jgi:hypothetical protein